MLKIGAALTLAYGFAVLINGLFYMSWSGDTSEFLRMVWRVMGTLLIAFGLWRATNWGWWFGVIFSGLLTFAGMAATFTALGTDLLASRPYPNFDKVFFVVSTLFLLGAFVCLLSRSARAETNR